MVVGTQGHDTWFTQMCAECAAVTRTPYDQRDLGTSLPDNTRAASTLIQFPRMGGISLQSTTYIARDNRRQADLVICHLFPQIVIALHASRAHHAHIHR